MSDIGELIRQVNELDDSEIRQLVLLLERLRADGGGAVLRRSVASWIRGTVDFVRLSALARETPTHYVWPLYRSHRGFTLMINEFKNRDSIGEGYSKVLHNHRYSFASLLLAGSYVEMRCVVNFSEVGSLEACSNESVINLREGDITAVDHTAFHRLTEISDRTVTLLLKTPPQKPESVSVDLRTSRVTRHVPVETRVGAFIDALDPRT
jgi:hypothetical protein